MDTRGVYGFLFFLALFTVEADKRLEWERETIMHNPERERKRQSLRIPPDLFSKATVQSARWPTPSILALSGRVLNGLPRAHFFVGNEWWVLGLLSVCAHALSRRVKRGPDTNLCICVLSFAGEPIHHGSRISRLVANGRFFAKENWDSSLVLVYDRWLSHTSSSATLLLPSSPLTCHPLLFLLQLRARQQQLASTPSVGAVRSFVRSQGCCPFIVTV